MHMRMWKTRRRYLAPRSLSCSTHNRYKYSSQEISTYMMGYAGIVGCVVRQRTVLNGTTFRWALSKPALHCLRSLRSAQCAVPIQGVVWWDKFEEEVEVGGSTLGSCDRTAGCSSEMPLRAALPMHLGTNWLSA